MTDPAMDTVEAIMREVAAEFILPRFHSLGTGQVIEKNGPDDLVTVADREAEVALTRRLEALVPGSTVIGEEAVSQGTTSVDLLETAQDLWLVDPVDGTYNFVQGEDRFGVMVAFLRKGQPAKGWILLPVDGRCASAEKGAGAFLAGERLRAGAPPPFSEARGDYSHVYVEEPYRSAFLAITAAAGPTRQGRCSAYAYTDLARGLLDYVVQYRMTPWDHAPGQLIVEEAGGRFGMLPGGEPYRAVPQADAPMLITAHEGAWPDYAARLMAGL